MEELPQTLAAKLEGAIRYRQPVRRLLPLLDGWEVVVEHGEALRSRHLVLALPVNACLPLLAPLSGGGAIPEPLPEAPLAVVMLAFPRPQSFPHGFGYLAPEQEGRFCLGCMFSSLMFPHRAPEGMLLLEALVGGRRHPERFEMDDDALLEAALADLRSLLPLPSSPPILAQVLRSKTRIPQMERGYLELVRWREAVEAQHQRLHCLGFGWNGIGINDMVKAAHKLAYLLAGGQEFQGRGTDLKGIYF